MKNSTRKFVSAFVAVSFFQLTACQAYSPMMRPANGAPLSAGGATVTQTNGTQRKLHDISVAHDTLTGFESRGFDNRVSIPLANVAGVQTSHVDNVRTALLVVALGIVAFSVLAVVAFADVAEAICGGLSPGGKCQ